MKSIDVDCPRCDATRGKPCRMRMGNGQVIRDLGVAHSSRHTLAGIRHVLARYEALALDVEQDRDILEDALMEVLA